MFVKNTAVGGFTFGLTSASTGAALTGASVTGKISKDGGTLATLAAAVSELTLGLYKVDLSAAELNADVVCLQFTATGAVPERFTIKTTTYSVALADRLTTAIPNAAPGELGGLPTVDGDNNLIGGINGNVAGDVVGRILGAGGSSFADVGVVAVQATNGAPLPSQDQIVNLDAKLGELSGTGNNTVLGMFKALASTSAPAPSDLGARTFQRVTRSKASRAVCPRCNCLPRDSIPFPRQPPPEWRRRFARCLCKPGGVSFANRRSPARN